MSGDDQEIREFIERRWSEAKTALIASDPDFVQRVDTSVRASDIGLIIPGEESIPKASHQLSDRWHSLLSLTYEVVQELGRLHLTMQFMSPDFNSSINREQSTYFLDVWIQRIFNLCEKLIATMKHTIRIYRDEQGLSNHASIERKYSNLVKQQVRDHVEKLRSPSVHGEGGSGNISTRVITEDHQSWELILMGGSRMIDQMLEQSYSGEGTLDPQSFYESLVANHSRAIQTLGNILKELDEELGSITTGE